MGQEFHPLRWNYADFEISYQCFQSQYKIYKYYLATLLVEKPGKAPYFSQIITKPYAFWDELNLHLQTTYKDFKKQIIIMKVLAVMFTQQNQILKEVKQLPCWLTLL
mmetsp:Transcript_15292/g.14871  ORF Transcript_15292/g.14871 Transcript_15292/m.14871 type:complete len:107 (-) Transcript_15292:126-446(-)